MASRKTPVHGRSAWPIRASSKGAFPSAKAKAASKEKPSKQSQAPRNEAVCFPTSPLETQESRPCTRPVSQKKVRAYCTYRYCSYVPIASIGIALFVTSTAPNKAAL